MIAPKYKNYITEESLWNSAGKPTRTDERVEEIFNICSSNQCGHYIKISKNIGQCGICSCYLRKYGNKLNKLRWSTTRCPKEEPLWEEEEGFKANIEIKENNEFVNQPSKNNCGC